mmetsp:Transcript_9720/g.20301  ORF Transcript_9720/g.20301 Transcript_9720/m.20301 type:complete len:464 (-) Transcript_9720:1483-2874(-)
MITLPSPTSFTRPIIAISSPTTTSLSNMSLAASTAAMSTSPSVPAAASGAAIAAVAPISTWITAFSSNKNLVGSAWIISSAILTTYSTTKFLKYEGDDEKTTINSTTSGGKAFQPIRSLMRKNQNREFPLERNVQPSRDRTPLPNKSPGLSRASLLTLYRFSGSLLLGLLLHSNFYNLHALSLRFLQTVQAAQNFLLPSLFLFIANYSNSIALDRIGISLTYTSKCGIPLITVLFTLLLDGVTALPSKLTLLSLLPIAGGIGAASWNSPTFELFGFFSAMVSTTSQAALNVLSKRVMRKTGVKGAEAQRAMVFVALGIGLMMTGAIGIGGRVKEWRKYNSFGSGVRGGSNIVQEGDGESGNAELLPVINPSHPPFWLTFLAVLAYHMEYVLSFCFVGLVEPITYGTCDAIRRLLIIVAGRRLFGGADFSKLNLSGIALALLGALMYSVTSARGGNLVVPVGKK